MTVADELKNRNNCRYRLKDVLVAVDGSGPEIAVAHTYWDKDSLLVVVLSTGQELPAERCELRSQWPVACCRPARKNQWNSTGKKWCK